MSDNQIEVTATHTKRQTAKLTQMVEIWDGDLLQAAEWLTKLYMEQEQVIKVRRQFTFNWWEGLVALARELKESRGFAATKGMTNPLTGESIPPRCETIPTGLSTKETVPIDKVVVFDIAGYFEPTPYITPLGVRGFSLIGEVKRKHQDRWEGLCNAMERRLRESSIYRGKAIHLPIGEGTRPDNGEEGILIGQPTFMDVQDSTISDLVMGPGLHAEVYGKVFGPVRHPRIREDIQQLLQGGTLLHGPYGCGKSMILRALAAICEQNATSFVMIDNPQHLQHALEFIRQGYGQGVLACEDLDSAIPDGGERTHEFNLLLNSISGITSKGSDVSLVVTTNHLDALPAVLKRRLGKQVKVDPPDAAAAEELIRRRCGRYLDRATPIDRVGQMMAGHMPALIKEFADQAVSCTAYLRADNHQSTEDLRLTEEDLLVLAKRMEPQLLATAQEARRRRHPTVEAAMVTAAATEKVATAIQGTLDSGAGNGSTKGAVMVTVPHHEEVSARPTDSLPKARY